MRYLRFIYLFVPYLVYFSVAYPDTLAPSESIRRQVHQQQLQEYRDLDQLDKRVFDYISALNMATGQWQEFDYKDHKRINPSWIPVLERIRLMTVAYTHPQSDFYKSETLHNAINRSLYFFTNQTPLPYCDNWYIQGITRPQSLTKSLVNMCFADKGLDERVELSLKAAICIDTAVRSSGRNNPNHKYNFGANKVQIAKGWIIMGAVLSDLRMLETGVKEVYAPIQCTTGEGIQYDLSYDMHYGYLYNGAYGVDFMESVVETAYYMKGTRYELDGERLKLFRRFIIESIFGMVRGRWMDWNVLGRGISRVDATKRNFSKALDKLMEIDPSHGEQYKTIKERLSGDFSPSYDIQPSHRHYWATDYTVHKRPNYTFSIHAVSDRNFSQEIGNQENLKGYWGAQGTTNLQLRGDEYYNIFPLWNWARLPGTTLPDTVPVSKNKAPGSGDRRGTDSFSGGVSDSLYGVTAYTVDNDLQTSYRKSWFLFDREIVCLGAGIKSSLEVPINTTLNQCLLSADGVFVKRAKRKKITRMTKAKYNGEVEAVWQDGVGYIFPESEMVELLAENRTGDWRTIRSSQQIRKVESKPIFQLSIQHGIQPRNATYAYILLPGLENPQAMGNFLNDNPIIITCNTDSLQAVHHKRLGIRQMVFYSDAVVYKDEEIEVETDTPVILMLKKISENSYVLHIADPTQQQRYVQLSLLFKKQGVSKQVNVVLDEMPYAGQSKMVRLTW